MNPVAFEIFGIGIRWYGILIAAAMLIGSVYAIREGKKLGYSEDHLLDLILVVLVSAIVGARLWYVAFNLSYYLADPAEIINLRGGGLAIHGGVVFGIVAGYFVTRWRKLDFFKMADIVAPVLALGQAIGRWGNFANQEAHGGPTDLPWGIMIDGVKVHPTFLYESLWNVALFAFLMSFRKNKPFDGALMFLYLIIYSVGRFWIEGLRTDSLMVGPFRTAQVTSIVMIAIGAAAWFWQSKRKKS
ncbi:prolipoprotein diacylglyceryl transferase [Acidaminobacter hydrogenoformans]|uniref:Phosphatidylglycerol--prolipoprotein diacylglyceryl transferase n=1 Tax=Acidaminobacter hydrogenoformans DSM 2784 TaxID=1120920 RepID=A0A1G5RT71_9FIRM|nr:prolipoprotein diacylglyceryl transferase [Acidaminobacter hydrogenoformans]SCZ77038.1 phosphatidylglycerol:prolipoprotein diacylglycerol transferase [Acidaminobacter hydrogenoformans DSM 2784]